MPLIDELVSGPPAGKEGKSLESTLTEISTGTPLEDFVITLMSMADGKGVLDDAFADQGQTVEDQLDVVGGAENQDFVDRDEINVLVEKFIALPPDQQQMILSAVEQEAPGMAQQIQAAVRLVKGKDGTK